MRAGLARLTRSSYGGTVTNMTPWRPDGTPYPVQLDEAALREELSDLEYAVLRQAGTERAFTGEYTDTKTEGVYSCRACSAELFRSDTKFDSHCGWPSFFSPLAGEAIVEIVDTSHGMVRTEVRCAACGSHLGHVFDDGYGTPTGLRYCINSVSLRLEAAAADDADGS